MGGPLPHMTPTRLRFLQELERMGIGEPKVASGARHACLKLKWVQGAYTLPDGRTLTAAQFDAEHPPGTDRWQSITFAGVTLTDAGREKLRAALKTAECREEPT